jgi:transcriptional regulator with XRE-family HTH domain
MSIKQGDYLKQLRTQNNLSQEKLAEKLGVSRQSISKWEQGYAVPDTDNMFKLSKLYGMSVDAILNCGETTVTPAVENAEGKETADAPVSAGINKELEAKDNNDKTKQHKKKKRSWIFAAYPVIAIFVMAALGCINSELWKTSWIFLLTIPLFYTGIFAYEKKNLLIFCYPVVVLIIFLLGGFYFSLWHPLWILFLTIPIYYIGAGFAYKNKKNKK